MIFHIHLRKLKEEKSELLKNKSIFNLDVQSVNNRNLLQSSELYKLSLQSRK